MQGYSQEGSAAKVAASVGKASAKLGSKRQGRVSKVSQHRLGEDRAEIAALEIATLDRGPKAARAERNLKRLPSDQMEIYGIPATAEVQAPIAPSGLLNELKESMTRDLLTDKDYSMDMDQPHEVVVQA